MGIFLKRIAHSIAVLLGICVLNFFLFHLSPGDPTNLYFGPKTSQETLQTLREQRGADQPWYQQMASWSSRVVQGDFGYSWAKHRPVIEILQQAVPATLQLTLLALLMNLVLGCALGLLSGIKVQRGLGQFLDLTALTLYSVPIFLLALVLILVFSLNLKWLPASGMGSLFMADFSDWQNFLDRLRHLILPVTTLGLVGAAGTSRYVAGQMRTTLHQDYVLFARAKGLKRHQVYTRHAFKNTLIPVVTLLGVYFPFLLSGAFIIEVIFAWPGMGRITYDAIFAKDYPVLMSTNLIAGGLVVAGNLVSDVLYRLVDPRIRVNET